MQTAPKQLVILSGKGGTGKTSLAAAFAHLAFSKNQSRRAVIVDADVDAANLELVLEPKRLATHEFYGGSIAQIDPELCQGCGDCVLACRFDAVITSKNGQGYWIDPIACEGCAACFYQCPENAISMKPQLSGHWYHSDSLFGPLFHAELLPAQENSGKLVTLIKQQARLWAMEEGYQLVIVDGPPGIGCPVISALAGTDMALIVAEPTAAGIHDMDRVIKVAQHFKLPVLVCINKADLYPEGTAKISDYCSQNQIELVGSVPFDEKVSEAMIQGKAITIYQPDSPASQALLEAWQKVTRTY